jgi:hypothetical protein
MAAGIAIGIGIGIAIGVAIDQIAVGLPLSVAFGEVRKRREDKE